MKISVLIHNLNRAFALKRCLSSVIDQSYRPLEVVLLDAGSTDDSSVVIEEASHLLRCIGIDVKVVSCEKLGVAASRNFASRHATGDLLCFIDNDAVFASSDRLRQMVDRFSANPRLALIGFQVLKGDTGEVDPVTWVSRRPLALWFGTEFQTFTFVGTGFCVRSDAFREAGGFWDYLQYSREEEDLAMALLDKNWELLYSPTVAIRHYPEPTGRMSLSERRFTELRNGTLVLWRRLPIPLALLAIAGRICAMSLTAHREKTSIRLLIKAVPHAATEWRRNCLRRSPIAVKSAWRYAALLLGANLEKGDAQAVQGMELGNVAMRGSRFTGGNESNTNRSILIIVQNLPVPFDRRVWQEATSLCRAGFNVAVICPKKKIYKKSYEQLEGVDIYRYSMLYDADKAALGFFIEFFYCWLATLRLAIKAYRYRPFQAIHACNPPDTYFALALLFRPLGVKFVFDHHDLCPEMYVAKGKPRAGLLYRGLLMLERLTLRSADAVIAVNRSHLDIALRRGGIAAEKITIVRSGPRRLWSEIDSECPELKRGRAFMVVFLGEMGSQDGVDLLLRTIRHYANSYPKDVLFTLIGGGPEQHRMGEMAHQLGLDDWTVFTGRVTEDQVLWRYLATADLCIAPDPFTEYGNLSTTNKIIEYMAFGKPVVAFDLREHRRTALDAAEYVEPNDHIKLSTATYDLLMDEDRRRDMGCRARQRFRTELSWENSEKELVALYSKLLGVKSSDNADYCLVSPL